MSNKNPPSIYISSFLVCEIIYFAHSFGSVSCLSEDRKRVETEIEKIERQREKREEGINGGEKKICEKRACGCARAFESWRIDTSK